MTIGDIDQNGCYIVGEIGINHNGNLDTALELINMAYGAGCDAVKFQKRTVDVVYTPEELAKPRPNPFGDTNGHLKRGLEFGTFEYDRIAGACKALNIDWYASPWDEISVDFMMNYNCPYHKIASASLTDRGLLDYCAQTRRPILLSTGMSTINQITDAVDVVENAGGEVACIYHCNSTYPSRNNEEINLLGIVTLKKIFPQIPIGYSGHERGVPPSVAAAVLGAASVERHITLDRSSFGSDQAASLEPRGLDLLCRDIRTWEECRGDGSIQVYNSELPIMKKLRRKDTL